jgi:4'-phosphopantetheinyl transferase
MQSWLEHKKSFHFSSPPPNLKLNDNQVHVWRASLCQSESLIQTLSQTLSMDEKTRAERFHFEKHRKRFIVGRGALRSILGRYLSVEPNHLQFCYEDNGKPRLAEYICNGTIHFNMSHSDNLALYCFTRANEIGVDIERIRDIPEMEQIAGQFFSKRENTVFRGLPQRKKKEAFFNCWTRKEAFIKARGDGLALPLETFDVTLIPGEPARLLSLEGNPELASRWFFQDLEPTVGYAAAFALERRDCQVHCYQWSN